MERRSGVDAGLAAAEAEIAKAIEALSGAEERMKDRNDGFDHAKIGELSAAVAAARQAGGMGPLRAADRLQRERADELGDLMNELRPWAGDKDALCAVPIPTQEQLQRWASTETKLSLEIASRRKEQERLFAETERLDAKIDALGSVAGVVSDKDAADARTARETAWAAHKSKMEEKTAIAFESAMRNLDPINEQRLGHSARVAELNDALLKRTPPPASPTTSFWRNSPPTTASQMASTPSRPRWDRRSSRHCPSANSMALARRPARR
jgi:hypothetical protein